MQLSVSCDLADQSVQLLADDCRIGSELSQVLGWQVVDSICDFKKYVEFCRGSKGDPQVAFEVSSGTPPQALRNVCRHRHRCPIDLGGEAESFAVGQESRQPVGVDCQILRTSQNFIPGQIPHATSVPHHAARVNLLPTANSQ